jgi:phosphotriesterase-related protein
MPTVEMHEHVFVRSIEIAENYPDGGSGWDEDIRIADAVTKLRDLAERGGATIVDPTVINLGRPRLPQTAGRRRIVHRHGSVRHGPGPLFSRAGP